MKRPLSLSRVLALLAALGLLVPGDLRAASPAGPAAVGQPATVVRPATMGRPATMPLDPVPAIVDVALQDGGILVGEIIDTVGNPVAQARLALVQGDREIASALSNVDGQFSARGLAGGVYQVATIEGIMLCRLWAPSTAPPAAQQKLLVVAGPTLVRGQNDYPPGPYRPSFFKSPVFWMGTLAAIAAVAVIGAESVKRPSQSSS